MKPTPDAIDKGFCIAYWRLSPRRKFLGQAWVSPLALGLIGTAIWIGAGRDPALLGILLGAMLLIAGVVMVPSMVDAYRGWKAETAD